MYIHRSYVSRLELTDSQRQMFESWAAVRTFAYNDARWRSEDAYARKQLSGTKPVKSIFDLGKIARALGITHAHEHTSDGCVSFTLTDPITGAKFALHTKAEGDKKHIHVSPDGALAWLQERVDRLRPAPPKTNADLRARHAWLLEAPAHLYLAACADLDDAMANFWKGAGYPHLDDGGKRRFRMQPGAAINLGPLNLGESDADAIARLGGDYVEGAGRKHNGERRVLRNNTIRVTDRAIYIHGSGGQWFRLSRRGHLPTRDAKFVQVSCYEHAGHWYVNLTARVWQPDQPSRTGKIIGIDVGIKRMAVDSDGVVYGTRRDLNAEAKVQARIDRLGRKLTRQRGHVELTPDGAVVRDVHGKPMKQAPSNGWLRTKLELQRAHKNLADMRVDLHHQATARLIAKGASGYRMEDIGVQGLLSKHRGGGKILRKLNMAVGYGALRDQVAYKAAQVGATMEKHNPAYTSQQCPVCGTIDPRMKRREFHACESCGFGVTHGTDTPPGADLPRHHRDFAAAVTHRDPAKHKAARDLAWAARHTRKGPAGSGSPGQRKKTKMGSGSTIVEQKPHKVGAMPTAVSGSRRGHVAKTANATVAHGPMLGKTEQVVIEQSSRGILMHSSEPQAHSRATCAGI